MTNRCEERAIRVLYFATEKEVEGALPSRQDSQ